MVRITAATAATLLASASIASADLVKRSPQDDASSSHRHGSGHNSATRTSGSAATKAIRQAAASSINSGSVSLDPSVSSIVATLTSGTPTSTPSLTLATTFTAGASNSYISGAPALPASTAAAPADYPALDVAPPTDSEQAQAWIQQYQSQLNGAPNIPVTTDQAACSSNQENLNNAEANHWWTCGGYTADTDITQCPDKNTWGLSYDDGPSPYTPKLLDYFEKNGDLKSTFFVVGSRAISRPEMLQYEYMKGHQLSVHTWSHTALTTQSNEAILLEMLWTMKAIKEITGVTPNTMRPPYGDIDDRVRYVLNIVGLTPIIWTSLGPSESLDTNDWKIQSGVVSAAQVVSTFDSILSAVPNLDHGYIVLEHDLYAAAVELATEVVLPRAQSMTPDQTLVPIVTCLKKPLGDAYIETNRNLSDGGSAATATASGKAAVSTGLSGSSSSSGSGGSSGAVAQSSFSSSSLALLGGACLGIAALL